MKRILEIIRKIAYKIDNIFDEYGMTIANGECVLTLNIAIIYTTIYQLTEEFAIMTLILCFLTIAGNVLAKKEMLQKDKSLKYLETTINKYWLLNYIKAHYSIQPWNETTEYITNAMMQHVISIKNPASKENFKFWCQKTAKDLSKYSLNQKAYEDMYADEKLKSVPEKELREIFAEINRILEDFPGFEEYQHASLSEK